MIRIKAETAVICKTNSSDGVNGDNINLNGKVLPCEIADKGYKGAGFLSGEFVMAISSGDKEIRAASIAMNKLSAHLSAVKNSRDDYKRELDGFFNDSYREISLRGNRFEDFDATVLYVYDGNLIVANMGEALLFSFDGIGIEEVELNDTQEQSFGQINYHVIKNINERSLYILLSSNIIDYLSADEVSAILRDAISVKQATQKVIDKAVEKGCEVDITVLVTSLTPNTVSDNALILPGEAGGDGGNDDYLNDDKNSGSKGRRFLAFLLTAIILTLVIGGVYFAITGKFTEWFGKEEGTTAPVAQITIPTTVPTTIPTTLPSTMPSTTNLLTTLVTTTQLTTTTTTRRTTTTETENEPPTTTSKPTTQAPTTTAPTTEAPTTEAPTTEAPTTETPTTTTPISAVTGTTKSVNG